MKPFEVSQDREAYIDDIWQELIEKDDRTSPAEYPEMALITYGEVIQICKRAEQQGVPALDTVVDRFLAWPLPETFNPDGGISFEPLGNKGTPHEYRRVPTGTNLLTGEEAKQMVEYLFAPTGGTRG